MIKVSFKDTPNVKKKEVYTYNDKVTVVKLRGQVKAEKVPYITDKKINSWIMNSPYIDDGHIYYGLHHLKLVFEGKAVRNDYDANDPVLAERIAESRAKIKLYRFMLRLCYRLFGYYKRVLIGRQSFTYNEDAVHDSLARDIQKYTELKWKEEEHLNKLIHG